MTTESQIDVFTPAERINLLVQFTGQAMQGILANPTADASLMDIPAQAINTASQTVAELEDHFRKEYAAKAAELKAKQAADAKNSKASRPLILVPGGGIIQ